MTVWVPQVSLLRPGRLHIHAVQYWRLRIAPGALTTANWPTLPSLTRHRALSYARDDSARGTAPRLNPRRESPHEHDRHGPRSRIPHHSSTLSGSTSRGTGRGNHGLAHC